MFVALLKKLIQYLKIRRDPVNYARSVGVRVGDRCLFYGVTSSTFGTEPFLISIGNHVEITEGVRFITHDGAVWVFRDSEPNIDLFGPIVIKDNVFIGMNSTILPGVTIGEDSIVGTGAVVTRDVPPGSIVAGVPAKVISTSDKFYEKISSRAFNIRNLPLSEKRKILTSHFGMDGESGSATACSEKRGEA